jgi:disulfide bond formation protein DsbB
MANNLSTRVKFLFLTFIVFIVVIGLFMIDSPQEWTAYPGWLIGIVLGIFIGYSFGKTVDFEKMQPKDPNIREMQKQPQNKKKPWVLAIPLGIVVGNLIARFFGNEVNSFISGVLAGLFCATIGYITIQVFRGQS